MKFREYKTSSGKKVLAGKTAKNNEELIVRGRNGNQLFALDGEPMFMIHPDNYKFCKF